MNDTSERNKIIFDRVKSGDTYAGIARDLGISAGRVRQIVKNEERRLGRRERELARWGDAPFSTATINRLYRIGIYDIDQLRQEIEKGVDRHSLGWHVAGKGTRNLGDMAWLNEILPYLESIGFDWRQYYTGKAIDPKVLA